MEATLKTWDGEKWMDSEYISTSPPSVVPAGGNGAPLEGDEISEWEELKGAVFYGGERVSFLENPTEWLVGLGKALQASSREKLVITNVD